MNPKKIKKCVGLVLVAILFGCCQSGATVTLQNSSGETLQVRVEVADTEVERTHGLMFRESLPEGTGMLFLFPSETQGSFWMKNTPLSLDLLFIKDGRIVSLIENATPNSEDLLTPDESYTSVLEVPGGYASRGHLHVADSVTISN